MSVVIVTGSAGLIGSQSVRLFSGKGMTVVGVDNDMRKYFFGDDGTTMTVRRQLQGSVKDYVHVDADIRDQRAMSEIFVRYGKSISAVVHCAAQPSHDWAAHEPHTDFTINANGTLNLLELTRKYNSDATFLFMSTNKVYGDTPNRLPLVEHETRWELDPTHPFADHGIDESMSIDNSKHSLFGVSKVAADLMVQEYGRYFGMKTGCFRGGCLTGGGHSGAELHGFLSYLMKCAVSGRQYTVFGYKGKQVRDNIHSHDMTNALWHFFKNPSIGAVFNMGGSRHSNCSILEAISMSEKLTGKPMNWKYVDQARAGDHIWWVSDVRRFRRNYPDWDYTFDIQAILAEIFDALSTSKAIA
ncbi:MAG TPA: NAD-dependent epimerase/dehydratase family protein [Rhodospirillales bacterium]|nr:NAD-dependent epimerase/dehydratase family protein [Rhodospirillales bacterium]